MKTIFILQIFLLLSLVARAQQIGIPPVKIWIQEKDSVRHRPKGNFA